jgi:two-component system chemotaxis response regulator CheY
MSQGLRVLIVDDSPTVRSLVKVYLMGHGLQYLEAGGAELALEILKNEPPDVVIADVNMPGMDGLTFLGRVRSDPRREVRTIPIVLLTSDGSKETRARAKQLGASDFVTKPVTSSDLQGALSRLFPGAVDPPPPSLKQTR